MVGLSFESLPFEDTKFWLVPIWVPQCERQRYFPKKRRFNLQTYVCKQADACTSPAKEGPLLLRSYNHSNYCIYSITVYYIYNTYLSASTCVCPVYERTQKWALSTCRWWRYKRKFSGRRFGELWIDICNASTSTWSGSYLLFLFQLVFFPPLLSDMQVAIGIYGYIYI